MNEKQRNNTFDIAKGIVIIIMVYCHSIEVYNKGFTFRFFYLFHMAFFFIVSGYFFKDKYAENINNLKEFINKRAKSLLIPYVFFNLIFLFLHNIFLKIHFLPSSHIFFNNLKTVVPLNEPITSYSNSVIFKHFIWIVLLAKEEFFVGTTWFLKVLFFITVCYALGLYIINKIKFLNDKNKTILILLICFICLIIGYMCSISGFNFYRIGTIFSCVFIFYLGILFRKFNFNQGNLIIFILSTLVLILVNIHNPKFFYISRNYYNTPLWLIIASVSGYFWSISLASVLESSNLLTKIFSYVGRNTIPILCLHLLCFKIVTIIEVIYLSQPIYMIEAYETYYTNHFLLGIAYTLVGVIIPILINFLYKELIIIVKNYLNK